MKLNAFLTLLFVLLFVSCKDEAKVEDQVYDLSEYGLKPDTGENSSPLFTEALRKVCYKIDSVANRYKKNSLDPNSSNVRIILPKGRYDFHPEGAQDKEMFISNHDQDNPKRVGIFLHDMENLTFDGQGSELVFHGRMLPITLVKTKGCKLMNFSIDFANPHISQVKILENDMKKGEITYEVAPWVEYTIRDGNFVAKGEGWEHIPSSGIAFEDETKRLVYRTSDIAVGTRNVKEIGERRIVAPWKNERLVPGTVVAMRGYGRPTPGIFLCYGKNTTFENIQVHYAEGMGLLAQMSENITLEKFSVCLRGKDDPRYFTTQADATHFSACKGTIRSVGGLYEGMMDDAINVHGTYLKIKEQMNDKALLCEYMHPQTYGFAWGAAGQKIRFIDAKTMEIVGDSIYEVFYIQPIDKPLYEHGAKLFALYFLKPLNITFDKDRSYGVENLDQTPEVYFADNTIRNNRARGSLFSTPRKTVIENNLFDHTSGSAILLCGDCNGWYETGACSDVLIRNNRFVNSLTNMFQFTNAVISIYPEIPDLKNQKKYFHSHIVIEDNTFETFDEPILYAKSVDGLIFRHNTIKQNHDYPAFHWNKHRFFFQRVKDVEISGNRFDTGFDERKDVLSEE